MLDGGFGLVIDGSEVRNMNIDFLSQENCFEII